MRRLACVLWAAMETVAAANGRPPATSTINFQHGNPQHVVAGMTFGALFSTDGGQTWTWMCEAAFPYQGVYDPVYQYLADGAVLATTFEGVKVMRDGCTFDAAPVGSGEPFVSDLVVGGSDGGTLYATASAPTDSTIYVSHDDGATFDIESSPGIPDDWWRSFAIAPSDPDRIYLTGYRYVKLCGPASMNAGALCTSDAECSSADLVSSVGAHGKSSPASTSDRTRTGSGSARCVAKKIFLMFRSDDAGATWTPISQANLAASASSVIDVVGVDPTDPDVVYIKIDLQAGSAGDGVYKSTNGGGSGSADATAWTKILDRGDPNGLTVLVRSGGSLVAATETLGTWSSAGGSSCTSEASCHWTPLANPPHINCLFEQPGSLDIWACTQNLSNGSGVPSDGAGIMKSSDLATWTPVLKFQDIQGPVACGSGTLQHDECVAPYNGNSSTWCCVAAQNGITSTAIDCSQPAWSCGGDTGASDNQPDDSSSGCCNGGGGAGAVLLGVATGLLIYRRRRA